MEQRDDAAQAADAGRRFAREMGLTLERASFGQRAGAFLIEAVGIWIIEQIAVALAASTGGLTAALTVATNLAFFYWMARDTAILLVGGKGKGVGASPGKLLLKLRVVMKEDAAVSQPILSPMVLRNIPFIIPVVLFDVISMTAGIATALALANVLLVWLFLVICGAEALVLYNTGERFGDRIAGTMVVKEGPLIRKIERGA